MPPFRMEFLGGFRVTLEGVPITSFESSKVRALLAYLATESGRPHSRESLAALLWPDWPDSSALSNLRYALSDLRKVIGDKAADPHFLLISRESIQFNTESDHWLDVAEFASLASSGSSQAEEVIAKLEQALRLYQGDFLEGFSLGDAAPFEDWARLKREQLHRDHLQVLNRLAAILESRGEYEPALTYARRQVQVEPLDESATRQLMRLLALSGRQSEAIVQYEVCRKALKDELKAQPSPETTRLYELLLKGELPPPAPETEELLRPRLAARAVGPCPYRGLAAFREQDAVFFYGREQFARRLEEHLQRSSIIAVIVGSSGSGKSSLVFAGVLPRLRSAGDWQIVNLRPGERPFHALAVAMLPLLEPALDETDRLIQAGKLETAFRQGELALEDVAALAIEKGDGSKRFLLVVDQFEELYTLCPDADVRRRFLDELLGAVGFWSGRREGRFVLLLTMRADFMGQALAYRPFADALQAATVLLGPMNREELQAAVEKPAESQGAAFESGLVERLLDDVGEEPGNLPLLEFALTLLWEHAQNGWLMHAAYEQIGRVEGALASYADQVYASLDADDQERARRALVQLVKPGEGTEDTRLVAARAELGEANWDLVQRLADRRLVVTGQDAAGNETAEVVHEALIQKWGRFREWMESDRAFRLWEERLRQSLRQWQESGEDEDALLRGAPLSVAEEWLAERGDDLNQAERAYIEASRALQVKLQRDRQRRRQRIYLGLAAGLVIALVLAAFALYQRQDALAQRQNTLRQASILLAGQAETELANGYHDRAVLLAMAALEEYPYTAQAEHALGQAVSYNRALQIYSGHASAVTSVAWSPDGKLMASSSSIENRVDVWDPTTGELVRSIDMPKGITGNFFDMALNVKWSPDGERLLTVNGDRYTLGSQDYDLLMWEAATGRQISSTEVANQVEPEAGDFSSYFIIFPTGAAAEIAPRSGRLATLGGDNTALIWDTGWARPALVLSGHTQDVNSVDWSPDETRLATSSLDGTARTWDAATGKELLRLEGSQSRVTTAIWSPDGKALATGGQDGIIRIWNTQDGNLLRSIQTNTGAVTSLVWAPNSVRIVSGDGFGSLRIWEAASGKLLETLRGHQGMVTDLKWSPVDDRLASADGEGNVRIWNAAPSTAWRLYPPQAARGGDWSMQGADWSSDGRYLAVAGGDNVEYAEPPSFALWDVQANKLLMEDLVKQLNYYGMDLEYSPDGKALEYAGIKGLDYSGKANAYIYDTTSWQIIKTFNPGGGDWIYAFAWSPDGALVAGSTFNGDGVIWDYKTGDQVTRLPHDTNNNDFAAEAVAWSPDQSKFAVATDDSNIHVYDAITWQPLYTLQHEPEPPVWTGVAWSPDSKRLLTWSGNDEQGAKDHTARIWDAATGKELLVFKGHSKGVFPGTWSPDGRRVVTGSLDGTVKIWDSSTGDELLTLSIPFRYLGQALWSPDGQHLGVVGDESLISVWRVWQSTEELESYAKECCVIRQLTDEERKQFALP